MRLSGSVTRRCRRPLCTGTAAATLTFRYDSAEVAVWPLTDEAHPTRWDLCTGHADALVVPRGWTHVDQREGGDTEPSGDEAPTTVEPSVEVTDRRNRYAGLTAQLSQIAASHRGEHGQSDPSAVEGADAGGAPAADGGGRTDGGAPSNGSNRPGAGAPEGREPSQRPPIGLHPDLAALAALSAEPVIPGQLRLPLTAGDGAADQPSEADGHGPEPGEAEAVDTEAVEDFPGNVVPLLRHTGVLDPVS